MTRTRHKAPSQRQLMVAEDIRHILANVMIRSHYLETAVVKSQVTVTEVQISPDLKCAKVYVLPSCDMDPQEVIKSLNKASSFYRLEVAKQTTTKYTPSLKFFFDETFDQASRIENLLRSDHVKQDLKNS